MKCQNLVFGMIAMTLIVATNVHAGPYTDELSKCLVEKTSVNDRTVLVKWVFTALSLHPAVKSIVSVSEEQLDEANKTTAELFTRLITDTCRKETENAIKFEGEGAITQSFQVLGSVAGRELFSSPDVNRAMSGLAKYLDEEKINAVVKAR